MPWTGVGKREIAIRASKRRLGMSIGGTRAQNAVFRLRQDAPHPLFPSVTRGVFGQFAHVSARGRELARELEVNGCSLCARSSRIGCGQRRFQDAFA